MRICTNCRRAYSRDNTFCPYCGMSHHSIGRVCHRGHSNPRDAIFCATCGSHELSQMAPAPPLWRRLLMPTAIIAVVSVIWFLLSMIISHSHGILSALYMQLMNLLIPAGFFVLIFFGITLLLPKHMGKYLRKVFFSLVRYAFRLIGMLATMLWRILSHLYGQRNTNRQRQYRR